MDNTQVNDTDVQQQLNTPAQAPVVNDQPAADTAAPDAQPAQPSTSVVFTNNAAPNIFNDNQVNQPAGTAPASSNIFNDTPAVVTNTDLADPAKPLPPSPSNGMSPEDTVIDSSLTGRIMDVFAQGWKHPYDEANKLLVDIYGEEPFGMSAETEEGLRKIGIFNDYQAGQNNVIKAFNESLMKPAAAILDFGQRTLEAVAAELPAKSLQKAGEAIGVLTPGIGESGEKFFRDTKLLFDSIPLALGAEGDYMGTAPEVDIKSRYLPLEEGEPAIGAIKKPVGGPISASVVDTSPVIRFGPRTFVTENYVDSAGNIDLAKIQTPGDINAAISEQAPHFAPAFDSDIPDMTRSPMSFDDMARLADASGITLEDLFKTNIGDIWNAEDALAARNLLGQNAAAVQEAAAKALETGSDADIDAALTAANRHAMIQAHLKGLKAELGRGLGSLRMLVGNDDVDMKAVLEDPANRANAMEMIRSLANLPSTAAMSAFIRNEQQFSTIEKIQQLWMAALLSNPVTHEANIGGNATMALWRVGETQIKGAIDTAKNMFGYAPEDRTYMGTAAAQLYGLFRGVPDGLVAAGKSLISGKAERGSKFEMNAPAGGPIGGIVGRAINMLGPTELVAEDQFFKTIATRASLHAQAYNMAAKLGLKGMDFFNHIAQTVQNPTTEMLDKAEQEAEYVTFTNQLGKTGRAMQAVVASHPWLRFIFPFTRTPINILKRALERTPLSALTGEFWENLSGLHGGEAQTEELAKLGGGSAILLAGYRMAAEGAMTGGGPVDPKEKALWLAQGNRPYSFHIGDNFYSYARFEPLSTMLGLIGDTYNLAHYIPDGDAKGIGALLAKSMSQNILSKTWMTSLSNIVNAVSDPNGDGTKWLKEMAGSFIPAAEAQYTRMDDPYLRDAHTIMDYLKSRISPELSKSLYPEVDVFGNDIKRDKMLGGLSPIYMSTYNNDPILKDMITVGSFPAPLKRQIRGVDLTPEQYHDYQVIAGTLARQRLEAMYKSPAIYNLPNGMRKELIDRVFDSNIPTSARARASNYMLLKYPDIIKQANQNRQLQLQKKFQ